MNNMLAIASLFSLVWSGTIVIGSVIHKRDLRAINLAWFAASVTGFVFGMGWVGS